MTTYWLQGEKIPPANNENFVLVSEVSEPRAQQPEQLLSQQANTPSIVRELVEDSHESSARVTSIKLDDHEDEDKKIEETTPLLTEAASNGATHPL